MTRYGRGGRGTAGGGAGTSGRGSGPGGGGGPSGRGSNGVTAFVTVAGPVPAALEAVIEKVYETPLARPVTVIGEPVPLAVEPPGLAVTVYESTAAPPP